MYLGTLAFIGECKKWGLNDVPVNDFMKKKLAEGKWNVHRMVREVEDKAGWDNVKGDLVERARVEPIIGIVYLVSDTLNKAVFGAIIDDARNTVKPVHLEVIVAPVYDWDWQEQSAQVRNAWTTSAKFCNDLGFDKHVAVLNTCTPPLDKNYVGKDKLWFVKQMMNALKALMPPPAFIKVNSLENGTGWDDSLSDDEPAPCRRRAVTVGSVCADKALNI